MSAIGVVATTLLVASIGVVSSWEVAAAQAAGDAARLRLSLWPNPRPTAGVTMVV